MPRFHRLLDWKRALEREALREKLALEGRTAELEDTIARLSSARRAIPEGSSRAAGPERVAELAEWSVYAEALRGREESVHKCLTDLRGSLLAKAQEHASRRQEVQGLELLEAREALRQKKERQKQEQEAIDEIASRRKLPKRGRDCRQGRAGVQDTGLREKP